MRNVGIMNGYEWLEEHYDANVLMLINPDKVSHDIRVKAWTYQERFSPIHSSRKGIAQILRDPEYLGSKAWQMIHDMDYELYEHYESKYHPCLCENCWEFEWL